MNKAGHSERALPIELLNRITHTQSKTEHSTEAAQAESLTHTEQDRALY